MSWARARGRRDKADESGPHEQVNWSRQMSEASDEHLCGWGDNATRHRSCGDSHLRQSGWPDPRNEHRENQVKCTWIPKISPKGVTSCHDRRLETSYASATEESSKERRVRCSQSIHRRLRAQQAKTQVRGPRKANRDSRQAGKLGRTDATGNCCGQKPQYCLPTTYYLSTLSAVSSARETRRTCRTRCRGHGAMPWEFVLTAAGTVIQNQQRTH